MASRALPSLATSIPRRRVVVTGIGLVTPLGVGIAQDTWQNLLNGEIGVNRLDGEEFAPLPCRVAAQVDRDHPLLSDELLRNQRAQSSLFIKYALAASKAALEDAEWPTRVSGTFDPCRTGVAIGSGIGGSVDEVVQATRAMDSNPTRGFRKISPFFVPRLLINLAAGHVSIDNGFQGPNHSCVTACASGAHSIGDAARLIQRGDADVMVAGGTEASINPLAIAGFTRLKALSTGFNDDPKLASRPFDERRDGFVMGEGAGVVVLEELDHALSRGVKTIYAEVRGYGLSGDAHHMTAPEEHGRGAVQCMKAALSDAALDPNWVDYINAHATSTPLGDDIELRAIREVFGNNSVAVSSTKGAVGHLLGAAGAVEAIFAALSVHSGMAPPTANLSSTAGVEVDGDGNGPALIRSAENLRERRGVRGMMTTSENTPLVAMSNSFGFGGTNASLVFGSV